MKRKISKIHSDISIILHVFIHAILNEKKHKEFCSLDEKNNTTE